MLQMPKFTWVQKAIREIHQRGKKYPWMAVNHKDITWGLGTLGATDC